MTDLGSYATLQAEILAALAGMTQIKTFAKDSKIEDLVTREGIRRPALGVACSSKTAVNRVSAGNNRQTIASLKWEVAILVDTSRGQAEQRTTLEGILEDLRDRLHFLPCGLAPFAKYIWQGEETLQLGEETLLGAVATYQLDLILCK